MFFRNYADATNRFATTYFLRKSFDPNKSGSFSYPHPEKGPLFTHVARFGDPSAERVLMVISGTHGVEGFLGSACQEAWVDTFDTETLPKNCRVYLVHALNPWGMAHLRRVDHENIDVNRNFPLDWNKLPKNKIYSKHAEATFNANLLLPKRPVTDETIDAIMHGQYTHRKGIFYGGRERSWSHRILRDFVKTHLTTAKQVAVVDFHTGIGTYSEAALICPWNKSEHPYLRAVWWYTGHKVESPVAGDSISAMVSGDLLIGIAHMLPGRTVTAVAAEFGTVDDKRGLLSTLIWENFAHHTRPQGSYMYEETKKALLNHFAPDDAEWQTTCTAKGVDIINKALAGLAAT